MGIFTGTASDDVIQPDFVSSGVQSDPAGARPGDVNDTLYGGAGNDSLAGGEGVDLLDGGSGNDTLSSTFTDSGFVENFASKDTLIGGTGDDLYLISSLDTRIVEHANEGIDTIAFSFWYWESGPQALSSRRMWKTRGSLISARFRSSETS